MTVPPQGNRLERNGASAGARLDIVIVNWNSGPLLRGCLDALSASFVASQIRVIVVDNASVDGSGNWSSVATNGLAVTLLSNDSNRGFSAACNQGAAEGDAPLLLFLNPDTRVETDTLARVLDFMAGPTQADIGVLGVKLRGDRGSVERTCARAPTPGTLLARGAALDKLLPGVVPPHFMTEWDHEDTREVAQVMGAFLLIRRSLFETLSGFDERFFVYYEDLDLCVRAAGTGARVVHFAGAAVWHQGQGTTSQVKDRRLFYILRSEVQYTAKHYGTPTALALFGLQMTVQVPLRVMRALAAGAPGEWRQVLRGARLLVADVPRLLRNAPGAR